MAERVAPGNDYLPSSVGRVARTLSFAGRFCPGQDESLIGEIGPGLLIMSERAKGRNTVAFGLSGASGDSTLKSQAIPFVQLDLNKGDLPDSQMGKVDLLYFCEVIEHLNRWPIDVLSDLGKLLSPEGTLIITTPNVCRLSTRVRVLSGQIPSLDYFEHVGDGYNHIREYGLEELTYYCEKAGLRVIGSEYWAIYPKNLSGLAAMTTAKLFPRTSNFIAIAAMRN